MPRQRLMLDGQKVTKEAIEQKIIQELKINRKLRVQELAEKLQRDRSALYRQYIVPLLERGIIRKVENSQYYTLAEDKITKSEIKQELYDKTEVYQTELFKTWGSKITAKDGESERKRFAKICLGLVNPKFKINPDAITKENWKDIVIAMRDAILEATNKPKFPDGRLTWEDKQTIRHGIMFGLSLQISRAEGLQLGIDGNKDEARSATLHIKPEQIENCKKIIKEEYSPELMALFGLKLWTGTRPSGIYIIPTEAPQFYDRKVEYLELQEKKFTNPEVLEFFKLLALAIPQIAEKIQIKSYTHRACTLEVYEHKQKKYYRKYIYDEELVNALEKYQKQRLFQKKKYLFWDDNETQFTFHNYDKITAELRQEHNEIFKNILSRVGFKKSDFGTRYFRANYGFRHFAIQIWLMATDYDYDLVAESFHETAETLKKWYGKPTSEHVEKKFSGVVA